MSAMLGENVLQWPIDLDGAKAVWILLSAAL